MLQGWFNMNNSIIKRAMLSDENMAVLSELQTQNNKETEKRELKETENEGSKQDELDYLWRNFKINKKEDRSPGIYILVGFVAGALSMFLMTAMLSISTFSNLDGNQSKQERKLIKKKHGSFSFAKPAAVVEEVTAEEEPEDIMENKPSVITDKYKVKRGDSLEAISVKYYGKASPENTLKLQNANNLSSPHSIYEGQTLLIPMK